MAVKKTELVKAKMETTAGTAVRGPSPLAGVIEDVVAMNDPRPAAALAAGGLGGGAATPPDPAIPPPTPPGGAGGLLAAAAATGGEEDQGLALLAVPMKRVLTTQGEQGYATTRVDVALSGRQAAALRDVFDALVARGTWKKPNPSAGDAVRWILDRLAEQFEASREEGSEKENEKEKEKGLPGGGG